VQRDGKHGECDAGGKDDGGKRAADPIAPTPPHPRDEERDEKEIVAAGERRETDGEACTQPSGEWAAPAGCLLGVALVRPQREQECQGCEEERQRDLQQQRIIEEGHAVEGGQQAHQQTTPRPVEAASDPEQQERGGGTQERLRAQDEDRALAEERVEHRQEVWIERVLVEGTLPDPLACEDRQGLLMVGLRVAQWILHRWGFPHAPEEEQAHSQRDTEHQSAQRAVREPADLHRRVLSGECRSPNTPSLGYPRWRSAP
jgi:hypothetical protein